MVGLSDIPIVGKVVDRISDATVEAMFRGFKYMFFYKALVNDLDSKIEKLNSEMERVSTKVEEERCNGKIIYDDVLTWQNRVEEIQKPSREFSPSWTCIHCLPIPNPVSRFRLGKEAALKASSVTQLTGSGTEFLNKDVAHLAPVDNVPNADAAFWNFQSRNNAYEKLWQELVDENGPSVLGIYGMPGVGKTRMMEQIWTEAKEKNIFKKITRADVSSEKLDVINLQTQIASHLDCHFVSQDDKKHRANQLKMTIIDGGKVLVILDDVWRDIPLIEIIGTSFGDDSTAKGCKILLTSRKRDVCLGNKCKHPVEITSLRHDEALNLFKNTVGTFQNDSLPDESLVQEVCTKCAGLPLLICAVGKALRFATPHVWKDALYKLNNCKIESVPGIDAEVYACLKLSFDNLTEDAQLCLLLCSMFPEDANISTTNLIQLAAGSQLVHGESVPAMLDILKSSSLLLENTVSTTQSKMHDIIRDMARYIAVTETKYAFSSARCGSRLPENAADYAARKLLYLELDNADFHFPHDLVCPDLHTLWLVSLAERSYEEEPIDDNVTKLSGGMFKNLRFLALARFDWQWQLYVKPLVNLRTLFLNCCEMRLNFQADVFFFPEKLESLCIWTGVMWDHLNLSNLKYLRKLEIQVDREDNRLAFLPNAISCLSTLEVLHIPQGFWGCDAMSEISKLTRLTSLKFTFSHILPHQDTTVFRNLLDYDIVVGFRLDDSDMSLPPTVPFTKSIAVSVDQFVGFEILIARAQEFTLRDSKVSNISNRYEAAFADLRRLTVEGCVNMEYLLRISHDEILHNKSFSRLTILVISHCSAMKYLFSNSVASCLVQLQELSIRNCPVMEVIVRGEAGTCDAVMINFPKLKSLILYSLPRLQSFYKENKDMHSSSGSIGNNSSIPCVESQSLFNGMVKFPSLEVLNLSNLEDTSDIWGKHNYDDDASSFSNLKSLGVYSCNKLEILIPLAMLHKLQNLELLQIADCSSMISEVGADGSNTAACSLVALHDLSLIGLPSLTKTGLNSIDHSAEIILYPNLEELIIDSCSSLRNVFLPSMARNSMHLKKMHVNACAMMREIIGADNHERPAGIVFPELTILQLDNLPNLTCFWCDQSGEANIYKVEFPNLVDLTIHFVDISLEGIELGRGDSICKLNSLYICSDYEIQLPCHWKLRSVNLESLKVEYCWSHELHRNLSFQRIKVLTLREHGCSTLFTSSVFASLQQLEELKISNCPLLEEIVEDAKDGEVSGMNKRATLFQLKSIILENLPNLKNFIHSANCEFHMPAIKKIRVNNCGLSTLFLRCFFGSLQQLENLKVSNCGLLECIFEDARGDETSDTDRKIITLFRLSKVNLSDLPNLKSFIYSANYECLLPAIKGIELNNCGLSTLFSCCALENLQQLKFLHILNCRWLECIVEDARGVETSDKNETVTTLSRLVSINLEELPNLKSFSRTTRLALDMPELQYCHLIDCPRIENLTTMVKKGEGCVVVFTEWLNGKETDLNDYIKQYVSESDSSDSAGESDDSDHQLETKSQSTEDEQPQYSDQETET